MKDWMRAKIRKPWKKATGISSNVAANWLNSKAAKKSKRKKRREKKQKLTLERRMAADRCAKYLKYFWPKFTFCETPGDRLALVKEATGLDWWVSKELRLKLREEYKRNRFRYLAVEIDTCGICEMNRPEERHHVVMLAYGGINADINLLAICLACHDYIHPWMKEGRPA
jgi:hypothetical protein